MLRAAPERVAVAAVVVDFELVHAPLDLELNLRPARTTVISVAAREWSSDSPGTMWRY